MNRSPTTTTSHNFLGDFIRPVIIAAHPDDEVIGLGGHLALLKPVIVHVTDGSPSHLRDAHAAGFDTKEAYATARRRESAAAMALAGIPAKCQRQLEFSDQESSLHLPEVTLRITALLQELKPSVIFTHPYEGGHPDHDATSFAVHAATKLLAKRAPGTPTIFEFTSYHAGPQGMSTDFLPNSAALVQVFPLREEEVALKKRMFDCFPTQRHVLDQFPIEVEQVRPAPDYDFLTAPHSGRLFYEGFDWGMDGERWRRHASKAQTALGI